MFTLTIYLPDGTSFLNEGGPDYSFGEVMDRMWDWLGHGFRAEIEFETRYSS